MANKVYEFPVIIEKDEDGMFLASVPSLSGCHTQAKTLPTLFKRIKEAIVLCVKVNKEIPLNKFIGLHEITISLPK